MQSGSAADTDGGSARFREQRSQRNETVCADVLGSPSSVHEYVMVAVARHSAIHQQRHYYLAPVRGQGEGRNLQEGAEGRGGLARRAVPGV